VRAFAVWALLAAPVWSGEVFDLSALPAADIVIVGEVHDNPAHHRHQAAAVFALQPRAIVFEMLTPEQAARVTDDNRSDPGLGKVLGWQEAGWPDFAMYQPIFAASSAAIYGAALGPDALKGRRDPATLLPDPAFGLAEPLTPDDQAAREAEQATSHCDALPVDLLPYMVAVQRLRDASFAAMALDAFKAHGGPVVVITGTGHARRDQGIPAALARAAPAVTVLSVGQLESDPGADAPYDLWLISAAPARPDPCAAFGTGN